MCSLNYEIWMWCHKFIIINSEYCAMHVLRIYTNIYICRHAVIHMNYLPREYINPLENQLPDP